MCIIDSTKVTRIFPGFITVTPALPHAPPLASSAPPQGARFSEVSGLRGPGQLHALCAAATPSAHARYAARSGSRGEVPMLRGEEDDDAGNDAEAGRCREEDDDDADAENDAEAGRCREEEEETTTSR